MKAIINVAVIISGFFLSSASSAMDIYIDLWKTKDHKIAKTPVNFVGPSSLVATLDRDKFENENGHVGTINIKLDSFSSGKQTYPFTIETGVDKKPNQFKLIVTASHFPDPTWCQLDKNEIIQPGVEYSVEIAPCQSPKETFVIEKL